MRVEPVRRPGERDEFDVDVYLLRFQTDFAELFGLRIECTFEHGSFILELRFEVGEFLRDCRDVLLGATHIVRLFHRTAGAARNCRRSSERPHADPFAAQKRRQQRRADGDRRLILLSFRLLLLARDYLLRTTLSFLELLELRCILTAKFFNRLVAFLTRDLLQTNAKVPLAFAWIRGNVEARTFK